jgi:hypothetical protein|tara:strand:- start:63 stop:320 length:258 start_codon:yes stop_codon:yes gene_type:complete
MAIDMNTAPEEQLTPEEVKERRQELTNFYKDGSKHLKVQLEYETLLTDIEEQRAKRLQASMFLAQSFAKQEANNQNQSDETNQEG